jgi:hypothetical protein
MLCAVSCAHDDDGRFFSLQSTSRFQHSWWPRSSLLSRSARKPCLCPPLYTPPLRCCCLQNCAPQHVLRYQQLKMEVDHGDRCTTNNHPSNLLLRSLKDELSSNAAHASACSRGSAMELMFMFICACLQLPGHLQPVHAAGSATAKRSTYVRTTVS